MFKKILLAILLLLPLITFANPRGLILPITGAIGPVSVEFFNKAIEEVKSNDYKLIIIELDTPGGFAESMRQFDQAILASPVPVVTYVYPPGARAASAGTYLLYASHIAAMAPETNLGAATPVSFPSSLSKNESNNHLEQKMINDSAAYIRGLANFRGRNADWAEQAVREAQSLTATEAKEKNVIDVLANSESELMQTIDGRTVKMSQSQTTTIQSKNIILERFNPSWRIKVLNIITEPNVAYVLLLAGIYGLIFEFANPGLIAPGVVGGICIILAMYALQLLPISYAALALMFLGIAFMVAEVFLPTFGALGIGGVVAFVAGSIMLFEGGPGGAGLAWEVLITFAVINVVFFLFIVQMWVRSARRKVVSGKEQLLNSIGVAKESFKESGLVHIEGENWAATADVEIFKGQRVKVVSIEGLVLKVTPVQEEKI